MSNWLFCIFNTISAFRLHFSSVAQSCPTLCARQASLSITNSRSSLRLMSIESVMPSSHLILCRSLVLLPPIPPSIRVFSSESTLRMRWPKYWTFSFSIISYIHAFPSVKSLRKDKCPNLIVQFNSLHIRGNQIYLLNESSG